MKLSREDLELRVLKHIVTAPEAMARARALNISKDHFGYVEEGSQRSFTKDILNIAYNYFDESDGCLLTDLVLENRLVAANAKDGLKGKFMTAWANIEAQEYDTNELHDLLMQLKHRRGMELWRDMHKEGHTKMTEVSLQEGVNYVSDRLKDIEAELSSDISVNSRLDITKSADYFVKEYDSQRLKPPGILSGYDELDKRAFGWRGGEVAVILGPSGGGKSLQLLNWAYNAHKQGKNVLYFSFELTMWQCIIRHMSLAFEVFFPDLKSTSLDPSILAELVAKIRGMDGGPYFEYDFTDTDATPDYVDMRIRELTHTRGKPDIVVADYIGEMTVRDARPNDKAYELHERAFQGLVQLARKHNIPVLTAQQINQETIREARKSKDSGKTFRYDQSAASGGQKIMHRAHYVFVMEPDRETNISVVATAKSRDMWIPPYCVKVVPENNAILELNPAEQEEMRRLKGLSHTETASKTRDSDNKSNSSATKDSDGNVNVSINDEEFRFNQDDLTMEGLDLDTNWDFGN